MVFIQPSRKVDKLQYEQFEDTLEKEVVLSTKYGETIKATLFLGNDILDYPSGADALNFRFYK